MNTNVVNMLVVTYHMTRAALRVAENFQTRKFPDYQSLISTVTEVNSENEYPQPLKCSVFPS